MAKRLTPLERKLCRDLEDARDHLSYAREQYTMDTDTWAEEIEHLDALFMRIRVDLREALSHSE